MHEIETTGYRESVIVCYDLRDAAAFNQASRDRVTWGRECSEIHTLDDDHVIIEFRPGGALEGAA